MKVRYFEKQGRFWGIQNADSESGKNLGWIKVKKGAKPRSKVFMVCIKNIRYEDQWPSDNPQLRGMKTNIKVFPNLRGAKAFADKALQIKELGEYVADMARRLAATEDGKKLYAEFLQEGAA